MVLDSVYLPAELLEVCLSAKSSKLAVLEVGLMNELGYSWDVVPAKLVILGRATAPEQSLYYACF